MSDASESFQTEVLHLIAAHRSPGSHVAGGIATEIRIDEATRAGADPGLAFVTPEARVSWYDDPTASPLKPVSGHIWPRIVSA